MKKRILISFLSPAIILLIILTCTIAPAPPQQGLPTKSNATPASMDPIIGKPVPVIPVANDWMTYDDPELGIHIQYPPDWKAVRLDDTLGVGFYPPDSEPNLPTPAVTFRLLSQAYTVGQPLAATGSATTPLSVDGITGQQYQDSKFSIPAQSSYIELPYSGRVLLIEATLGPITDLRPQLWEMLKTLHLSLK